MYKFLALSSLLITSLLTGAELPYAEYATWLTAPDPMVQVAIRNQIREKSYKSILNIPCGLCYDYFGIKNDGLDVEYVGCDVACNLVNLGLDHGISIKKGHIEEIPFCDSEFDLVYARSILEHLPTYENAVQELVRVAKKEVLIVFSSSLEEEDVILQTILNNEVVYNNRYDRVKFENFVLFLPKVQSLEWENDKMVHVYLKTPR